jgi:hypothetical protein
MENNGILPLDSEQKNKNKLRFENLERMKEMEKVEDKETEEFFTYLKEKFIKECLALGFEETAVLELADKGVMDLTFDELLIRQKEEKIKKKFERERMKKQQETGSTHDEEEGNNGEEWNVGEKKEEEKKESKEDKKEKFEKHIVDNGLFFKRVESEKKRDFKPKKKFMLY